MKYGTHIGVAIGILLSIYFGLGAILEFIDGRYFVAIVATICCALLVLSNTVGIRYKYDIWSLFEHYCWHLNAKDF